MLREANRVAWLRQEPSTRRADGLVGRGTRFPLCLGIVKA